MEIIDYTTAYATFSSKISTVKLLQERVNGIGDLLEDERDLLFESMFMGVFRAFENLVENCFLFSMRGMADMKGEVIPRFAEPVSRAHARDMLLGAQTVLDWTTSTTILRRHDIFLNNKDSGLYLGVTSISSILATAKDLRNHIAHNSDESALKYVKVVANFFPTSPLEAPAPGALLSTTPTSGPAKDRQVLTYFRERLTTAAKAVAGVP